MSVCVQNVERVLVEWESGCKCVTRCSTRGFKRGTGALDTVREGEGNPRTHSTHLCRHLVFFLCSMIVKYCTVRFFKFRILIHILAPPLRFGVSGG
jgi:hypothetical protein